MMATGDLGLLVEPFKLASSQVAFVLFVDCNCKLIQVLKRVDKRRQSALVICSRKRKLKHTISRCS